MFVRMNDVISYLENKNIFTSRLAFARTLLAINALLLLLFTDFNLATDFALLDLGSSMPNDIVPFKAISIFELIGSGWGKIISIIILLFVITGYFPKISIFLQAWVHISICNSVTIIEGGDQIASNLCLLLIPICTFDSRNNQWNEYNKEQIINRNHYNIFFNIYYFLIVLQVSIIYLHSAIGKLCQQDWLDGTCLYYWTTHNVFGAPLFLQKIYSVITLSSFVPVFTWGVIIFELGLFACILATNKYIKRFFLLGGILFHFGILVTHGLVGFFFSMFAALVLYLDTKNEILFKIIQLKNKLYGNYFQSKTL
jgi:antimicrobial peptide system SdpB family protein